MLAIETEGLPGLGPEVRPSAQPGAALGQAVDALGLSGESAGLAKAAAATPAAECCRKRRRLRVLFFILLFGENRLNA